MKGTAIRQIDTNIKNAPKHKSLLWDGSINLEAKPGPEIKHAKVTPAAFALHNSDIAWSPTPTWLKNDCFLFILHTISKIFTRNLIILF